MVRQTLLTAAAVYAAITLAPLAHADTSTEARKAILAAYARQAEALTKKDPTAMLSVMSPDFVGSTPDGHTFTLAQIRQRLSKQTPNLRSAKVTTTIQNFDFQGNKATDTARHHSVINAVSPQTHKIARIVLDTITRDTWIKGPDGWLLQRSQVRTRDKAVAQTTLHK